MANTFYSEACIMDAKSTPMSSFKKQQKTPIGKAEDGADGRVLNFYGKDASGQSVYGVPSIMNENVAINYRNIYNGFPEASSEKPTTFTDYDDYQKCMGRAKHIEEWQKMKQNPTYKNIIYMYSRDDMDPFGLARYKMQDFIYCKYYNQIPNNYMVTLRRYTRPCEDRMFGLDVSAAQMTAFSGNPEGYFALATAVTYLGEKPGNKLSEILKFDYGMNWEDKEAKVESLKNPDGGLAAQLAQQKGVRDRVKASTEMQSAGMDFRTLRRNSTDSFRQAFTFAAAVMGKGVGVGNAQAAMHAYEGDEFAARYGEEFYGDVNVINKVKMRSRGITFTNNFSLNFEYSLKSLKCVNPRVAMIDILTNFLILTGNYGNFWGGATIFYGQHNIAPQYGDPAMLRQGKYGQYLKSLFDDVKMGFQNLRQKDDGSEGGILKAFGNVFSGGLEALLGNLLGGNVGLAGQALAPQALLSGNPSGYWHVTIGNPLDPIAMMGNMAVTKTSVQVNDILGYDDFPTEIKFTVDLEHARPRDNGFIENMFNAGKGRIYTFGNKELEYLMHNVDTLGNFVVTPSQNQQEVNMSYTKNGVYTMNSPAVSQRMILDNAKIIGGNLN